MNAHIENIQTIMVNGHPAFAVIPYGEYTRMRRKLETVEAAKLAPDEVPHEVAKLVLEKNFTIVKAWRVYLRMNQKEAAEKIGITQSALSQLEKSPKNKAATLERIANSWGIHPEQLTLD